MQLNSKFPNTSRRFNISVCWALFHRFMYWADSYHGRIDRAAMDGSNQTTILKGLHHPRAITIDFNGEETGCSKGGVANMIMYFKANE